MRLHILIVFAILGVGILAQDGDDANVLDSEDNADDSDNAIEGGQEEEQEQVEEEQVEEEQVEEEQVEEEQVEEEQVEEEQVEEEQVEEEQVEEEQVEEEQVEEEQVEEEQVEEEQVEEEDDGQCPASYRSGRLIILGPVLTRSFAPLSLANFVVFSAGAVAAAPAIAVAASGGNNAVFSFGTTTSVDYDYWSTFPIIQLPSWSISAIYGIVAVFGIFYLFGFVGTSIPGLSTLSSAMSGLFNNPLTDRFNRVFRATVSSRIDDLTNFVYTSVNNFRRRNYYSNYYNRYYGHNSRVDYDEAYDYYNNYNNPYPSY